MRVVAESATTANSSYLSVADLRIIGLREGENSKYFDREDARAS